MSETVRVETHFSGGAESPDLEHYRPISPLVVVAGFAAVASLLAIVHPLLWVIPVVAVVLSISAIVQVSAAHSRYSGRAAALTALCFAALVGTYAPARMVSRERALYTQARLKADAWLALLQQGRVQEAHQLSLKDSERFQGPGALAEHYADVPPPPRKSSSSPMEDMTELGGGPPNVQLKGFVASPGIAKLLEFGEQSRIEHLENVRMKLDYGNLVMTLRYRATTMHDGQPESIEFLIRATRQEAGKVATWNVDNLELMR